MSAERPQGGGIEKRHYYRVSTHLPVRFRAVEPDEGSVLLAGHEVWERDPAVDVEHGLARWLERLERKLDRVLAAVDLHVEPPLGDSDAQDLRLSGGGLGVYAPRPEAAGQPMFVELLLPGNPSRHVRALARVVDNVKGEAETPVLVAMEFTQIDERDRDAVIEHVQEVQRHERRLQRRGEGT